MQLGPATYAIPREEVIGDLHPIAFRRVNEVFEDQQHG
jgi:hypothetical protein